MSANNALHIAVLGGDGIGPEVMAPAIEVLRKIAAGKTVGQIAAELHLGVTTVSTHRARLMEKMRMSTTAELIRYGLENDLAE